MKDNIRKESVNIPRHALSRPKIFSEDARPASNRRSQFLYSSIKYTVEFPADVSFAYDKAPPPLGRFTFLGEETENNPFKNFP